MNVTKPHYITSGPIVEALNQQKFENLIPAYILTLSVICVGLPGNIIIVCVYLKKMRQTVSRVFILALAFCDLTNCILTMPVEIAIILNFWSFDHPVICAIGRTLTYILNGSSALLLVGIAVDRFRKICRPLKPVFTLKQARVICLVCFAMGVTAYFPGFALYGTRTEHIHIRANTIVVGKTCLIRDVLSQSKTRDLVLSYWFLLTFGVMLILIILYCMIGIALYTRDRLEKIRKYSVSMHKSRFESKRKIDSVQIVTRPMATCLSNKNNQEKATCLSHENNQEQNALGCFHVTNTAPPRRHTFSERMRKGLSRSVANDTRCSTKKERVTHHVRVGHTSMMLFSVTIAFILSFIPFVTIIIVRTAAGPNYYSTLNGVQQSFWDLFLRSYTLNCAVNPVLYGFFNKEFRNKMLEVFEDICNVQKWFCFKNQQ